MNTLLTGNAFMPFKGSSDQRSIEDEEGTGWKRDLQSVLQGERGHSHFTQHHVVNKHHEETLRFTLDS